MFWNISSVCNLLYLLIGLQWNTLDSKSNQDATGFLQHQVDKENSIELSFNYCTSLIHIQVSVIIYIVPHIPFYSTLSCVQSLETKRKEKKNKYWLKLFCQVIIQIFRLLTGSHSIAYGHFFFNFVPSRNEFDIPITLIWNSYLKLRDKVSGRLMDCIHVCITLFCWI